MRRPVIAIVAATILVAAAGTSACSLPSPSGGRIPIVAAFYPLQFLAQTIGGDLVHVTNLVKPGAEPHDLELNPRQMASLVDAKIVLYLRGFQPAVDDAVAREAASHALDVATVQPLVPTPAGSEEPDALDPHVWLDPVRFAAISQAVESRLIAIDPASAADFTARGTALRTRLADLDHSYATGLAHCVRHEIVTSHAAFGYLAARYHLLQIPIVGLTPESEPEPRRLAEVAALARRKGVTTIFFETLVSPKVADTLATEVGATAQVLDPIEGLAPGSTGDYVTVMTADLAALRTALGCS